MLFSSGKHEDKCHIYDFGILLEMILGRKMENKWRRSLGAAVRAFCVCAHALIMANGEQLNRDTNGGAIFNGVATK